jgi:hypothetical protein
MTLITFLICLFCIATAWRLAFGSPVPSPNFKSQISNFKSRAILVLVFSVTAFVAFVIGSSVALYLRWLFRQLF